MLRCDIGPYFLEYNRSGRTIDTKQIALSQKAYIAFVARLSFTTASPHSMVSESVHLLAGRCISMHARYAAHALQETGI